jgi:hypothetical protein
MGADLLWGVWQGGPFKALRHLPPELVGVCDGLEEEGVLLDPLDPKGVVDAADACNHNSICTLFLATDPSQISRRKYVHDLQTPCVPLVYAQNREFQPTGFPLLCHMCFCSTSLSIVAAAHACTHIQHNTSSQLNLAVIMLVWTLMHVIIIKADAKCMMSLISSLCWDVTAVLSVLLTWHGSESLSWARKAGLSSCRKHEAAGELNKNGVMTVSQTQITSTPATDGALTSKTGPHTKIYSGLYGTAPRDRHLLCEWMLHYLG